MLCSSPLQGPLKSAAVNMVASTFWFFVTSTFFYALCVTQGVLAPHSFWNVLVRLLRAKIVATFAQIKRGRIAVVLKSV